MSDGEPIHAILGASSAARWVNCPGSVALGRDIAAPPSSHHAEEGTAAHALAELCLRGGADPATFVDTGMDVGGGNFVVVDEAMAEHVRVFVEAVRAVAALPGAALHVEERFSLARLTPPAPMYGTADAVVYVPGTRVVHLFDLKYGSGVVVEVTDNLQLGYYAVGALLLLEEKGLPVDLVRAYIVQPRVSHPDGAVRSQEYTREDLMAVAAQLLDAADATQRLDAPRVVGSWCRWCKAKPVCPERRAHAELTAGVDFADVVSTPKALGALSLGEVAHIVAQAPLIEDWLGAMRAHLQRQLENGTEVPGWKLVRGRTNRKWRDEEEARTYFLNSGLKPDEVDTAPKLKSVAQMEKLVKKAGIPADLVSKPEGKITLVPSFDARAQVVLQPGSEFLAIPATNETSDTRD